MKATLLTGSILIEGFRIRYEPGNLCEKSNFQRRDKRCAQQMRHSLETNEVRRRDGSTQRRMEARPVSGVQRNLCMKDVWSRHERTDEAPKLSFYKL